jgi:UDP-N-acetylglucosamine--N-acetylmuramyl-(pentapeptide) pyrophosphoryl-undecaprenol N-acetylglucosamine transferase
MPEAMTSTTGMAGTSMPAARSAAAQRGEARRGEAQGSPALGPVVVFSGGGTGGHLYPALALAAALEELRPDVRAFFVGARRGIEARKLPELGREHLLVDVEGLPRTASPWKVLRALFRAAGALARVQRLFARLRPALVVVTGGYAGLPAGLAARLQKVPLVLQEQNAAPGLVTRLLARWGQPRQIHLAYPEAGAGIAAAAREHITIGGNPIRHPRAIDRSETLRNFGLQPDLPVLLVVGGSQGSAALNAAVLEWLETEGAAGPRGLQVLWSTGPSHLEQVQQGLAEAGSPAHVHVRGFLDDMDSALGIADLALSRAGAMATSEFLAWGVAAVLVPLPTAAADHQTFNARALAEAGAAVHLPQKQLTGAALGAALHELLDEPSRLDVMRQRARERGQPDAARDIARQLARLLPRQEAA